MMALESLWRCHLHPEIIFATSLDVCSECDKEAAAGDPGQ